MEGVAQRRLRGTTEEGSAASAGGTSEYSCCNFVLVTCRFHQEQVYTPSFLWC